MASTPITPNTFDGPMESALRRNKKKNGHSSEKSFAFYIALVALPLIQYAIFYIYVNFNSILLAFQDYDRGSGTYVYVGFKNIAMAFRDLFAMKQWGIMLRNTFLLFALDLVTKTPLTLILSYFISRRGRVGSFVKILLFLPSIVSTMILVMTYQYFVENALPAIGESLFSARWTAIFTSPRSAFWAIWFFGFFAGFGNSILIYVNAMQAVPISIYEAAEVDGAGFFRQFRSIVLPMVFPTFKELFMVSVSGLFGSQFFLFEFYGLRDAPAEIYTVGYYIYQQTNLSSSNYPRISAIGLILTCIIVPIALAVRALMNRVDPMR